MKNSIIFVVFVIIVVAALSLISGKRSPRIPEDATHALITDNKACMECHNPGKPAALKADHPPKTECLICHKTKRRVKT